MKGISYIVSALIVFAVAIVAVSIYAEWAPHFAETITGSVTDETDRQIKCGNADLSLNEVEYDLSGGIIILELENPGTIRYTQGVNIGVFNESTIVSRVTVPALDVGEERLVTIESEYAPDRLLVTTIDCPEIDASTEDIEVT